MRKLDSRKKLSLHSQASTSCSSLWQQEPLRLHCLGLFRDVTSVVTTWLTIFKSHLLHVCSTGAWSHHDNHHPIYRFRFLSPDTHENRFAINPDLQSTHNLCRSSMIKKTKTKQKNLLQFQFQEMKVAFHFTGPIFPVVFPSQPTFPPSFPPHWTIAQSKQKTLSLSRAEPLLVTCWLASFKSSPWIVLQ